MNCIITGGAGFIGSHLSEYLIKNNKYGKIFIIDNLVRTNNLRNIKHLIEKYPEKIEFIYGDVSWFNFTTIPNVSCLFHLAATRINRCVQYPEEGHRYITDSGYNIVNYCANNNVYLYFASSASVYASPKRLPILESDPCEPPTLYGSSKLYTENIIRNFSHTKNLRYSINRYFSVYGPRMDSTGVYTEVIFNWLNNIFHGNHDIIVYGDPHQKILDLVYVDDVIKAISKSIDAGKNEVYNVSTEYGTTLNELINIIEILAGTSLNIIQKPDTRTDIEAKRIGSTKNLRAIEWTPEISITEGIKKTYEWISTLE